MWFPLEDVIDMTDGLRWEAGKERMRVRRARPRLNAMLALKAGNVRDGDFSRMVSSLNCMCRSGVQLGIHLED